MQYLWHAAERHPNARTRNPRNRESWLWSFGKTEPLNVNLWTEGVLKQDLEFYWVREQSETEVLVQLRY